MFSMAHGPPSRRTPWWISCAFSWTYAFLSSLSADQPWRYCGSCPGKPESRRLLGKSDGHGVWLQGIRRTTRSLVECAPWAGRRVTVLIEDWQRCRHRSARYVSTGQALAAINLTISASTERQWQGIRRPRDRNRVLTTSPRSGMMPIGIKTMTRRRALTRAGCCPDRIRVCIGSAITWEPYADGSPVNAG